MKVLLVNVFVMGENNATGVTLKNMLYKLPGAELCEYCADTVCEKKGLPGVVFYQADEGDDPVRYMINKIRENKGNYGRQEPAPFFLTAGNPFKELIHGIIDCSPFRINQEVMSKMTDFAPDVIYTLGGSIKLMKTSLKLAKKLQKPIVFHCMDDWRSCIYTASVLSYPFHFYINHLIRKVHKYAVMNLAICEDMAEIYERDYKIPYSYASNCVFEFNEDEYCAREDGMLVVFSGGLHFGRGNTLLKLAGEIERLNTEGYKIHLEIYAPEPQAAGYKDRFVFEHTTLLPYVDKEKQMENLKRADALLHVESENSKEIQYMKLSFSTKLVEYFAAGRTVIGFGNKEIASLKYIEKNQCGAVAENMCQFRELLISLLNHQNTRKNYAEKSYITAKTYHSRESVQERIFKVFETSGIQWRKKEDEIKDKD